MATGMVEYKCNYNYNFKDDSYRSAKSPFSYWCSGIFYILSMHSYDILFEHIGGSINRCLWILSQDRRRQEAKLRV